MRACNVARQLVDRLGRYAGDLESGIQELRWLLQRSQNLSKRHTNHGRIWMNYELETLLARSEAPSASQISNAIKKLSPGSLDVLKTLVDERVDKHVPLQYLLGSIPFGDLELLVKPSGSCWWAFTSYELDGKYWISPEANWANTKSCKWLDFRAKPSLSHYPLERLINQETAILWRYCAATSKASHSIAAKRFYGYAATGFAQFSAI